VPRPLLRWILLIAAVLCVPAVAVIVLFASTATDSAALRSARPCAEPTRDRAASCLSIFDGVITSVTRGGKALDRAGIKVDGTSIDVGYACFVSPPESCRSIDFRPGAPVTTEWWRGQVVAIGGPESRPTVVTDGDPGYQLRTQAGWLLFAVPGLSLMVVWILAWQAPAEQSTRGSSRATHLQALRVALGWGRWSAIAFLAWVNLYTACVIYMAVTSQYTLGLLLLGCTGLISFGCAAAVAFVRTENRLRAPDPLEAVRLRLRQPPHE
jgi:hypothetical protein